MAKEICDYLGLPLGEAFVGRFNNGEVQIMIDESVRGKDVFIIQPTSYPVNDNLMELMVMADALKTCFCSSYYSCSSLLRLCSPRPQNSWS